MCSKKLKKRRQANGEILINHLIEAQEDLFRIIRGGQSWDKNLKKIDKPVEEIVLKKYHEHLHTSQCI